MSTFDPTLQKPGLPPIGTRVRHTRWGLGTVRTHDNYVGDHGLVQLDRLGVEFDQHDIIVCPAYFDADKLEVAPEVKPRRVLVVDSIHPELLRAVESLSSKLATYAAGALSGSPIMMELLRGIEAPPAPEVPKCINMDFTALEARVYALQSEFDRSTFTGRRKAAKRKQNKHRKPHL